MIGVSSSYAFAGFFLTGGFVFAFLLHRLRALPSLPANLPPNMDFSLSLITALCLFVGIMLFVLAALPSILPSALSRFLSLLPCLVFLLGIIQMVRKHLPLNGQLEMLAALLLSLLSDVVLFVAVRQSIRWISVQLRPLRVCLVISGQIALIFLIVWLPQEISGRLSVKYGWKVIPQFLIMISGFNVFTAIAACIFILVLSGVLIHHLFWPFVSRLFYQVARYRLVRNHKAMASLGAICMIFAFPSLRGLVAGILGWLQFFQAK
jgi:hypothetical protein